jgi:hypothetical protein
MDATRSRRTRDAARRRWYALSRCRRFSRRFGGSPAGPKSAEPQAAEAVAVNASAGG